MAWLGPSAAPAPRDTTPGGASRSLPPNGPAKWRFSAAPLAPSGASASGASGASGASLAAPPPPRVALSRLAGCAPVGASANSDMADLVAAMLGQRSSGKVKSYNPATGFGFIESAQATTVFNCDVFLRREEAERVDVTVGSIVTFNTVLTAKGQPQARDLAVEIPGQLELAAEAAPRPELDADGTCPRTFRGVVKSFFEDKGYGFIACSETFQLFRRDVFIHYTKFLGFKVGDAVYFRIQVDDKGCPKGFDLNLVEPPPPPLGQPSEGAAVSPPPPPPAPVRRVASAEEEADPPQPAQAAQPPQPHGCSGWGEGSMSATSAPTSAPSVSSTWAATVPSAGSSATPSTASASEPTATEERTATAADGTGAERTAAESMAAAATRQEAVPTSCSEAIDASGRTWQQFLASEEAVGNYWWWCEASKEFFVEATPEPWQKFQDPETKRSYWYRDEQTWFYVT